VHLNGESCDPVTTRAVILKAGRPQSYHETASSGYALKEVEARSQHKNLGLARSKSSTVTQKMPPPAPPVALKEHCTVIHDNVLYVYSPDALQSLPLQKNATWSQEPMGISVAGGTCVLGGVDGDHSKAALYVVGGSTNSSSSQYPGLQRYSIQDKRWDTINPVTRVTQNRKHHGSAFLNASSSILVYAGSQDGDSNPSTQTFLIETWPPYNVRSFNSLAPPVVDPIMLRWGDNRAAMIGGSSTNNQVFTFGPDDGWADAGVALTKPPPNRSIAQSALLSLVDESKVLVTFDMSQSPNTVTRTVLLNPGGQQAQYGQTVGDGARPSRLRRKEVVLSTYPPYNDSLAPQAVRNGASLAQDPEGLTVITGGDDQDPILIFDALGNQWVDATNLIGEQPQTPIVGSPTSSMTTPTASSSSTSVPTGSGSRSRSLTILGAVLGSICGIAAILIIALLVLRWKKQKRNRARGDGDFPNDKKGAESRLSFEDQGMQPIRAAAQPMGRTVAPSANELTMVGGKGSHTRQSSSMSSRLKFDPQRSSNISFGPGMFSRTKSPLAISGPIPQGEPAEFQERPGANGVRPPPNHAVVDPSGSHRKNDSGWSTYFSGNTAVDIGDNRRTTASQASRASSGSRGSYWPDPSAPVAKLRTVTPGLTDSNGNQLAKLTVQKGSPSIGHSGFDAGGHGVAITEGIPAKISNTNSVATSITDDYDARHTIDNEKHIGSAYPSSQPVDDYSWAFQDSSWSGPPHRLMRPPSSTYTNSIHPATVTSPGQDWSKPSIRPVTQWPNDIKAFPAAPNSRPGTSRGPNPPSRPTRPGDEVRDYFGSNHRQEPSQNDMSWLNLNGSGNSNENGNGNR
jgi:hypothetical protein